MFIRHFLGEVHRVRRRQPEDKPQLPAYREELPAEALHARGMPKVISIGSTKKSQRSNLRGVGSSTTTGSLRRIFRVLAQPLGIMFKDSRALGFGGA